MVDPVQKLQQLHQLRKQAMSLNRIETVDPSKFSHNDYREQIEAAKPSADPSYWAKPGCHDCHGKGVVGVTQTELGGGNKLRRSELCPCAKQNWQRWQDEFVANLRAEKEAASVQVRVESDPTSPEAATSVQVDPKVAGSLAQIDRLTWRLSGLQSKIDELSTRSVQLPQRQCVAEAESRVGCAEQDVVEAQKVVAGLQDSADLYEAEAHKLLAQARLARQSLKSEAKPALEAAQQRVVQAKQEVSLATKQLQRADHQLQKKIREFERQGDKLRSRILRIQRECDLYPSVLTAEDDMPSADLSISPSDC